MLPKKKYWQGISGEPSLLRKLFLKQVADVRIFDKILEEYDNIRGLDGVELEGQRDFNLSFLKMCYLASFDPKLQPLMMDPTFVERMSRLLMHLKGFEEHTYFLVWMIMTVQDEKVAQDIIDKLGVIDRFQGLLNSTPELGLALFLYFMTICFRNISGKSKNKEFQIREASCLILKEKTSESLEITKNHIPCIAVLFETILFKNLTQPQKAILSGLEEDQEVLSLTFTR